MRPRRWVLPVLVAGLFCAILPLAQSPATAATVIDQFDVSAHSPLGRNSNVTLDSTRRYLVEVSGWYTYDLLGPGFNVADGECHALAGATTLFRDALDPALGRNVLDLMVDGHGVEWVAQNPSPLGCDDPLFIGNHNYTASFQPTQTGTVNFRIFDSNHADNVGSLHVRIFEAAPQASLVLVPIGSIVVDSRNPGGSNTPPLLAGTTYVLQAAGSIRYDGGQSDAECANTSTDSSWKPNRFGTLGGNDWLDLLVGNGSVDWQPAAEIDAGCSSTAHVYRVTIAPTADGSMNLRLNDNHYEDNSGVFSVVIFQAI